MSDLDAHLWTSDSAETRGFHGSRRLSEAPRGDQFVYAPFSDADLAPPPEPPPQFEVAVETEPSALAAQVTRKQLQAFYWCVPVDRPAPKAWSAHIVRAAGDPVVRRVLFSYALPMDPRVVWIPFLWVNESRLGSLGFDDETARRLLWLRATHDFATAGFVGVLTFEPDQRSRDRIVSSTAFRELPEVMADRGAI